MKCSKCGLPITGGVIEGHETATWHGTCPEPTPNKEDLFESQFIVEFKKLKQLRNSHQIDEPDFDERVEQLAADTYAHRTEDGYCCACEADVAFFQGDLERRDIESRMSQFCEIFGNPDQRLNRPDDNWYAVPVEWVDNRWAELESIKRKERT